MSTLKQTVNSMVDQLSAFVSEVTRVALKVGTQGGQAKVEGPRHMADLTRNVNVSVVTSLFLLLFIHSLTFNTRKWQAI